MKTSKYIWMNGEMIPWENATVHVMSHALHYGSSVFEGMRAYDTPNGPCIFRLDAHIKRLFESAKLYRYKVPFTADEIAQGCKDSIAKNELDKRLHSPVGFSWCWFAGRGSQRRCSDGDDYRFDGMGSLLGRGRFEERNRRLCFFVEPNQQLRDAGPRQSWWPLLERPANWWRGSTAWLRGSDFGFASR